MRSASAALGGSTPPSTPCAAAARPPPPPGGGEPIYAIGKRGIGAIYSAVHAMRVGGYISEYDQKLAQTLGRVLCGGDLTSPQWVTEQYILDLEWAEASQLA